MGPFTIIDIIMAAVSRDSACVAKHRIDGRWTNISSKQLHDSVVTLAGTLQDWGIKKGDRVAILSENRPEWAIADFAALSIGAVDVPIYATLIPEQIAAILKDSGARIAFVSNKEQLEKLLTIQDQTSIEKIVIFDEVADATKKAIPWKTLLSASPASSAAAEWERLARSIQPDDLATIIYTSGT